MIYHQQNIDNMKDDHTLKFQIRFSSAQGQVSINFKVTFLKSSSSSKRRILMQSFIAVKLGRMECEYFSQCVIIILISFSKLMAAICVYFFENSVYLMSSAYPRCTKRLKHSAYSPVHFSNTFSKSFDNQYLNHSAETILLMRLSIIFPAFSQLTH